MDSQPHVSYAALDWYSLALKEYLWKFQRYFVSHQILITSLIICCVFKLCHKDSHSLRSNPDWGMVSHTVNQRIKDISIIFKDILYLSSSKTFILKTYYHIRNQITNETQDEQYHNEWVNETANDCKRLYKEGQKKYFRSKQLKSRRKGTKGVGWSVSN